MENSLRKNVTNNERYPSGHMWAHDVGMTSNIRWNVVTTS